ncbi:hypothetical protein SteCoe_18317 [Stentor coeruleus]|uniref:cGMP-dependent protein kinase n=1 Tax=Stentor coeruleus TaxID=5963 RepID=A0A1R2BWW0_9CILI|nr:hypothetical protein SteCoe_18317 [Stentor coeruleus]
MEHKEEVKSSLHHLPRNPVKKRAPVHDARRVSKIAIDAPNALVVDKPKGPKDLEIITNALNKHFIFTSLTEENRSSLISQMKHYTLAPHEIVFEQEQPGVNFFVIASGQLEVLVNSRRVNIMNQGDSFGELALLHDSVRSATVITIERTTMWGLDRKTFRSAVESVNAQNYQENKRFIESVPLFQILTPIQKENLVGSLSTLKFRSKERIVNEGDPGDLFYIIKEGSVVCTQGGKEIREMGRGDFFGEQALLYNSVRTASIIALNDVKCVAIGRDRLTKVLGTHLQQIIYQNSKRMALDRSEVLCKLDPEQNSRIISNLRVESYPKGRVVIPAGIGKGAKMFIVLKGKLKTRSNILVGELFNCLGDKEIIQHSNEIYEEEIISDGDCDIAEITKQQFEECIGGHFEQATANNEALVALKRVQVLRGLSQEKLQNLISVLRIQDFEPNDVIVQQNSPGETFYIVKSGRVDVLRDGVLVRTITKLDYFGERSVLFNENRTATVVANGNVTCWVLHRQDFLRLVDETIRQNLIKRIELQDDNISLRDLVVVKVLGKGMFGNVFLVADKNRSRLYALKTVSRKKIERYEIQENLILERKILLQLDNMFILKLVRTFKDTKRIYFLTEFVRGLDLFDVLRQLNLVSDRDSKFYAGCLILMFEHLHERDIIYRDLKPENVMVDEEGYPKLIDFGIAKIVQGRTYTVVGTPHYMAPEVIVGKGYSLAADFWSVGIMLYEFVCGGVPFGEEEEDPYVIYEKVIERKLIYPSFVDPRLPSKPVIEQLLSKNPAMRTGGSIANLKSHPWFHGFNWEALANKQMPTPYKPRLPDLTREIQTSLKTCKDLNEIITKEEAADEPPPSKSRRPNNISENWDQEF